MNPAIRFDNLSCMNGKTGFPVLLLSLLLSAGETAADSAPSPSSGYETARFSMYCYWEGEATVGTVPGVVASRIGHLDGKEIVEVTYDPARTDVGELARALERRNSFYSLLASSAEEEAAAARHLDPSDVARSRGEPHFIESKHSLRVSHPELYYLDLSEAQAIALNAWSHFGGPMPEVLSAEQQRLWTKLREKLRDGQPWRLDPGGSRSGEALAEYRRELKAWLADD